MLAVKPHTEAGLPLKRNVVIIYAPARFLFYDTSTCLLCDQFKGIQRGFQTTSLIPVNSNKATVNLALKHSPSRMQNQHYKKKNRLVWLVLFWECAFNSLTHNTRCNFANASLLLKSNLHSGSNSVNTLYSHSLYQHNNTTIRILLASVAFIVASYLFKTALHSNLATFSDLLLVLLKRICKYWGYKK